MSHAIEDGTITYPGLPGPIICDYLSRQDSLTQYDGEASFHIGRIDMVANSGTYIDSPFHRYAEGKDLAELPLTSIADLEGLVVRVPSISVIEPVHFESHDVSGRAVLIQTDWSSRWGTPEYLQGHPYLTASAADYLLEHNAALVGIDSLNIDDTNDGRRPVHSILLGADIPIVEHLTHLDRLPATGFRFHAAPVKVRAFGTFPIRAYAVVD